MWECVVCAHICARACVCVCRCVGLKRVRECMRACVYVSRADLFPHLFSDPGREGRGRQWMCTMEIEMASDNFFWCRPSTMTCWRKPRWIWLTTWTLSGRLLFCAKIFHSMLDMRTVREGFVVVMRLRDWGGRTGGCVCVCLLVGCHIFMEHPY